MSLANYEAATRNINAAIVCWQDGHRFLARGWARRAVGNLPKGSFAWQQVKVAYQAVSHARLDHAEQRAVAIESLASALQTVERAYWSLWGAQEAPDHWMAL